MGTPTKECAIYCAAFLMAAPIQRMDQPTRNDLLRQYGSHLGCVTANACRMRSSACDTFARLCPERALLARIPLGPRPSLHRRRGGLLRFVRTR
jgi:hypothetical protein